ncbi:hypothetical protein C8J35_101314 [Rhizobium sp. PP-F2F-G38]|nr:hypothetical protein C8J37_101315 [Rhizobium sp. PP-WC-1G-195]PYF00497.1 hypothetical protein C8J35_101314 [Rhizobium sp. PP-F2F-G38]
MIMALFLSVCGLFVGLAGIIGDWNFARIVGGVSLFVVLAILCVAGELKANTLDLFS